MSVAKFREAVGPCPICKREDLWFNSVPLTAFCWGTEEKPHKEVQRIVPMSAQPYKPVPTDTYWRYASNRLVAKQFYVK